MIEPKNVYYIQNREAILEKGRLYRAKQRLQNVKRPKKEKVNQIYTSNNNNLIVCFD